MCKNQGIEIVLLRIIILLNQLSTQLEKNPNSGARSCTLKEHIRVDG